MCMETQDNGHVLALRCFCRIEQAVKYKWADPMRIADHDIANDSSQSINEKFEKTQQTQFIHKLNNKQRNF